ncbi:ATP-binding protein [Paracoccus contaminans]|uniref:Histidine kinase/HSP90-like ATPase domain-containing protein n=1 Tax=Paracoccus contaminans TaxID=1945662 RepID=A0A1W6CWT2_9RHOB|nr:ATP-binding protein [Paracoccus contaminans]ARJ69332.1 hypothetical protein B0A89_06520 [Paracoccus contaminans]
MNAEALPAAQKPAGPPGAPAIFHQAMDATLVNVRKALAALRLRLGGSADPDALDRLELVLAEVMNNIALYGSGGQPAAGALAVEGMPGERGWPFEGVPDPAPGQAPADARPVTIHLTVTRHASGLACAVVDNGTPLPPDCLALPASTAPEISALRAGGFGWSIIHDLTQSLFYTREDSRNVLCFDIPLGTGRGLKRHAVVA